MLQIKKTIDIDKIYTFPNEISVIEHKGKIIVIAVEKANWIVLENESQLQFFNLLRCHSIRDAIKEFGGGENDYSYVITQIEARQFERQQVYHRGTSKIQLFITNGCNLQCPHCYMYAGKKAADELTLTEIQTILDSFAKHNGKLVVLTGGEVKTRKDFFEIVTYAHNLGLSVEVLTNGTLWLDDEIKAVSHMLSSVQISIDGYDDLSNSKVRGRGNFAKSMHAVELFIQNGVHTEIAITPLYDKNLEFEIDRYVAFGKSLLDCYKENSFRLNFTADLLPGRNISVSETDHKKYAEIVSAIYRKCFGLMADNVFITTIKKKEIFDNCAYGNIAITSNGDAYLCGRVSNLKPFANIRQISIDKLFSLSEKAKSISCINNLKPCQNCEVKFICGGECRITHFPYFRDNEIFTNSNKLVRHCPKERKEMMLDLMLRTNKKLYE